MPTSSRGFGRKDLAQLLFAAVTLGACPMGRSAAQNPAPVTIRGTVVSAETGQPLPLSIVALRPGHAERFTDERGAFAFPAVPPGTYRLIVRQIGYTPADTALLAPPHTGLVVRVALGRVAIELPPVTVTARPTCERGGPPDHALTPHLASVFDQLAENARRLALLADAYPFRFQLERTTTALNREGVTLTTEVDTLDQDGEDEERPYRPGQVVGQGTGPWRDRRVVWLPTLRHFAESAFVRTHCFRLVGRDTIGGERLLRVDFEPARTLRSTDLAGAAYLDSLTFQVRYTRVSLTRPERALQGVRSLVATTRFREIAPGIVLHDQVRSVTTLWPPPARSALPAEHVEEQRLLAVQFVDSLRRGP